MSREEITFCRICEPLCGLRVTVEQGRVVAAAPDPDHVASRGHACVKGLQQHRIYNSPDRLRQPLKRTSRGFAAIDWAQALDEIGRKVQRLRSDRGPDSIGLYLGAASGFSLMHPLAAQGFVAGLGSKSLYGPATQDCANKFFVAQQVYGFAFTQPFPDIDRCGCLIMVGANPAMSKFSFLNLPDPLGRLQAIERRGGRVFWIDPRRTESARAVGEHVFIRPGSDLFFYLGFLQALIAAGGVDRQRVARHMDGYQALAALVRPWTPERCAAATGIAPDRLHELVAAYRRAEGAALYCSTGVNMGPCGSLAFWLQEAINAVSGNLDRAGGSLVGRGLVDLGRLGRRSGLLARTARSRIGHLRSVNDCFPGGILADEILTPGAGQLRALFVSGGNPLLSMPNAAHLRRALAELELLVVVDIQRNETAELADYVLPATSPYERPDLLFLFPLLLGLQARPYLQATRAVARPPGEARDELRIYTDLARACGIALQGSGLLQKMLELGQRWGRAGHPLRRLAPDAEALFSALLLARGQPSFGRLAARHPHGKRLAGPRAGDFLGQRVPTAGGRVQLAPRLLLDGAAELESIFARQCEADDRLRLITKRAVRSHNSWTHNLADWVRGERNTNHLYIHPDDAQRLGLVEGEPADVRSDTATVRLPVRLCAELMPGAVALPHGWGHQPAPGLRVASRTRGVNVNLLAADGVAHIEPLSGMSQLTALPVSVRPAAGPIDPRSWSGLPPGDERG